jgi:hypothetical protein
MCDVHTIFLENPRIGSKLLRRTNMDNNNSLFINHPTIWYYTRTLGYLQCCKIYHKKIANGTSNKIYMRELGFRTITQIMQNTTL